MLNLIAPTATPTRIIRTFILMYTGRVRLTERRQAEKSEMIASSNGTVSGVRQSTGNAHRLKRGTSQTGRELKKIM
jgi:hypothetical protein